MIVASYIFQHWTNKAKTTFRRDHLSNDRFAMEERSFLTHWEPKCTPATIDPARKTQLIAIAKAQVKGLAQARKIATIEECLARPTLRMTKIPKSYDVEKQAKRIFTLTNYDGHPPRGFWISNGIPYLIDGKCMSMLPKSDEIIWRFPSMQGLKVTVDITNPDAPVWEKTYSKRLKLESTWEPCGKGWEQASKLFVSVVCGHDLAFDVPPELTKSSLAKAQFEAYFYKQKITIVNRKTGETIMEIQAPDLHKDICIAFNMTTLFRSKAKRIAMHTPYSEHHTSIKACRIEHENGEYGLIMPVTWSQNMLKTHGLTQGTN
mgnify:CR=1 FL=1